MGKRILWIDHHAKDYVDFLPMVRELGEVVITDTLEEATEAVEQKAFDLVIIGLAVPKTRGELIVGLVSFEDTNRWLKEVGRCRIPELAPIVYFTGYRNPEIIDAADQALGRIGIYVGKTTPGDKFVEILRPLLG